MKRYTSFVFLLLAFLAGWLHAAPRTVRVSFYQYPCCHEMAEDGTKSGYGYDFMEMLAAKAGWKVEYVGYDRPWDDMFGMLERGELDVVDFVGWREERTEKMLFSEHSMVYSGCSIRTLPANMSRFNSVNFVTWGAVRVGVMKGDNNELEFRHFAEDHNLNYKIIEYADEAQAEAALRRGELELVAFDGMAPLHGLKVIDEFNPTRNHLVTRKDDTALMAEINTAMARLEREEPGWMARVRGKYYPTDMVVAYVPSAQETSAALEGYQKALLMRVNEVTGWGIEIRSCKGDFSDADFSVPSFACGVTFSPENSRRFRMPLHSAGRRRADLFALKNRELTESELQRKHDEPLLVGYLHREAVFMDLFARYADDKGIAYHAIPADTVDELHRGLEEKRFEVIVRPSCTEKDLDDIVQCGYVDFFFAPPLEQEVLAHSLTEALKYLRLDEPESIYRLEREYFSIDTNRERLVRLGAYVERGLSERNDDGTYSGFVIDFTEAVAKRAGWNLQAITLSFPEAQRALAVGAVDLIGAAVWTPERAKVYDYSKFDIGPLYYALMKRPDGRMLENRPDTWQGAKIGVQRGSLSIHDLERYLAERQVEWQAVSFNNLEEGENLVRDGKLDAVYALANEGNRDLMPLAMLPTKLCYFCSNKHKPWVKAEMDMAVEAYLRENHRYITELYEKHLATTRGVLSLDLDEIAYVRSQRGRKIQIAFSEELRPLVSLNRRTGEVQGVYRRLFDRFEERTGLGFEYLVGNEQAEVMLGVDIGSGIHDRMNYCDSEWSKAPVCWVRRKGADELGHGIVALPKGRPTELGFVQRSGFKVIELEDREACYRAVEEGQAEKTIDNVAVACYLIDEEKSYQTLQYQRINPSVYSRSVALYGRTETDPRLRSILAKARDALSSEELDTIIFESIYGNRPWAMRVKTVLMTIAVVAFIALLFVFFSRRQAMVANAANQAKTAFLNAMSHDIRTPMNAITGFAQIARKSIDDRSKVIDCLDKIDIAGGHLLRLINEALDMGRIESGRIELRPVRMDILAQFEALRVVFNDEAAKKGLEFKVDTTGVRHPFALADALRVDQVLLNLVGNAIKYTKNGRVTVKAVSEEGEKPSQARYRITVEDTGTGMSADFLKRIFEPFAREQTSTVSGIQGAGLGMAIVKKTVDLMGGTIAVTSQQGTGTTVTLELVFETLAADEAAASSFRRANPDLNLEAAIGTARRVLLVEDNEMNREVATELLSDAGLDIETAEDGSIAVKRIAEKGVDYYDFVLMDIQMPVMDGYEATKAIRKMAGGDRLPIIALSANAFEEDRQKSLAAGMNAHEAKPIKVKALLATMDSLSR